MFGRKKGTDGDEKTLPERGDELTIPVKPGVRPAGTIAPGAPGGAPPRVATPQVSAPPLVATPQSGSPAKPADVLVRPLDIPRRPAETPAPPPAAAPAPAAAKEPEARRLIVGREISLSGEITSCDRLIVEGSVEADLTNCRDIDIAEGGLFKGSATIEDAEIRGRFEGILTVRRRLHIHATGKVTGTVRYGQIEIACGGQISGSIEAQAPETRSEPIVVAAVADGKR